MEDVVYVGLAILLAASAIIMLGTVAVAFGKGLATGVPASRLVAELLDQILLVLMIVEILYTVQVSFREHALVPEPFLIVGLIAGTRRILVLTAEFARLLAAGEAVFRSAMIELALLTITIPALVASLVLLRKRPPHIVADRAYHAPPGRLMRRPRALSKARRRRAGACASAFRFMARRRRGCIRRRWGRPYHSLRPQRLCRRRSRATAARGHRP